MPNIKEETVQKWISEYPELLYDHASRSIYCSKCESHITAKKCNINRHVEGAVHKGTFKRPPEEFYSDLIKFLVLCNIPWSQMKNPAFKEFFQKYICTVCCCTCTSRKVPDESLLRKVYLDKVFTNKIKTIYEKNQTEKLWISLDETTDFLGRNIVHFLIKPLHENISNRPYLIACKMLEVVNGQTIANFVIQCLENLWQNSFEEKVDNILILCTDSVAYMISAGQKLKCYLPQLKHVTCFAHALHRVSEQIRMEYNDVDILISNVKKIFLKAPSRVRIFKRKYPDLPLPPQPIITRWGTWLEAASYYAKHFDAIKDVLSHLCSSDAIAIRNAKNILQKENIQNELQYIDEYFSVIPFALKELQKHHLTLSDSFLILDTVRTCINECASENIKNKIEKVIERNPDIDILREWSEKIVRNETDDQILLKCKFAPMTSTDVERSFSIYKWIMDVKRNTLKMDNIEKLMVIYFNSVDGDGFFSEELVDDETSSSTGLE
ncbi:uncharacterized protein LOC124640850 [Helicoverpa zea]|uniref:uncharacterized protein LOC124634415 n=1 Tax=Helicoverpa zea TaxID=7113 RepID=UPI001F57A7DD|nr:uncharacterized protein LOC124634415 [Helicoverpa zea]XP_047027408.1 uncharacterized protein LOC124635542 [Helicoverpa zea]XP_047027672.1 uncharacterized protein LOC124635764 [Helicoverpa zea]XP_047029351.1 uncharacterized protein LOC124637074 [Helicoverpa zea]XP_047032072.1 uncharacterized protein LOC124638942 [Helicoverpa zea]XP_047034741.1 uncharacterized protein LOC124640850 [Helicoverpa zea]XP_049693417.1 uncharacterized protein LOC126053973 [Helicoverpa armigera]XP_049693734.1 uncha